MTIRKLSGDPQQTRVQGDRVQTKVTDHNAEKLLGQILVELQKANLYLSVISNTEFTVDDVEDETL